MRSLALKVADWILPSGSNRWLRTAIHRYRYGVHRLPPDLRRRIIQNKIFLNRHLGERCFILATGPSIRQQNLKPLEGELCIAVGDFYLHPDIDIIRPRYHCVAPYHHPFQTDAIQKRLTGLARCYRHQVDYFFGHNLYPFSVYRYFSENPDSTLPGVHYINYSLGTEINDENHRHKHLWDISGQPFAPRTVIYIAIQVAAYMGFTTIYLLGADHDYLQDIHRVTNHHFYPEEQGISDAEHLRGFSTERWFEEYYFRWKQYRLIRQHLESRGIHIYNATQGGMLDVFPRVEYDNLFS